MASERREVRVGDLVKQGALSINDGYRVRNSELGPDGIPFVRGGDIGDGWINTETHDHIRPEFADRVTAKRTQPEDVAFITKGTVGRAGWLRPGQPPVVFAPQVAYWRVLDRRVLDPRFVFYLVRSREFLSALDAVKTHGAMVADYVSISQQHDFRLRIPEIEAQRAIGLILGALDDKIELNRRMSETLEAMARALFKSWFVDFESGETREGWRPGTLADVSLLNPEVWSRTTRPAVIDYVDLSNTKWGRIESVTTVASAKAPSRAQRVLRHGDTIIGTVRPGNGSYAFVQNEGLTGSTGFAVLRPRQPLYAEFVYLASTTRENIDSLSHLADGGAYPAVRPDAILATEIVRPTDTVLKRFAEVTGPLMKRLAHCHNESGTLAAIRDALLPKLISGELRVKDAEALVAAAPA